MDRFLVQFGRHVALARSRAELTQEDLYWRCGIHVSEISKIENGHKNIKIKTVARLAQALGVTPGQLMDGSFE